MNRKIWLWVLILFGFSCFGAEFSSQQALKIDNFLKRIAREQRKSPFLKKVTFGQQELNSYLNLIYVKKYAPEVKYINLKLDKNNFISGSLKVKLTGEKYESVPGFLKDFELEFSGKVECDNYRMRYMFEEIRINGTSFSPEILDEAFSAAQSGFKVQKSIFDWFSLVPGLKKVLTDDKKIILYY